MRAERSRVKAAIDFLGIDCSLSNTGIALYNKRDGYHIVDTISTSSKELEGDRLKHIFNELSSIVKNKRIRLAVMEGPSFSSINRGFSMGAAYGIVKLVCSIHDIKLIEVPPKRLKKYFAGKGTATKEDMVRSATSMGLADITHDEADAVACCTLALDIRYKTCTPSTRAALEVMADLGAERS
jgi:Holliday junction resolvasome RuvABC endonuclease subunit